MSLGDGPSGASQTQLGRFQFKHGADSHWPITIASGGLACGECISRARDDPTRYARPVIFRKVETLPDGLNVIRCSGTRQEFRLSLQNGAAESLRDFRYGFAAESLRDFRYGFVFIWSAVGSVAGSFAAIVQEVRRS